MPPVNYFSDYWRHPNKTVVVRGVFAIRQHEM
ncbi:hypothetical protein FOXB_05176 [Fusarium oxysporum f. sp. conglutinans Fo5176]|uniref:Uncharacterized protein n=1 Tax=Fusarium oxysporum (strain Fo5176) TaxID=660025 RepID=F9FFJ7_FUSOF|nr:hypothetical protein FOXB_05176 [Fusarium oxysporum f. sp. conglutinans Fo5176]